MRTHRRRGPLDHVVIAGSHDDAGSIATVVALLPADAYGQVFVERSIGRGLPEFVAPPRVAVVVLPEAEVPGQRAAAALDAWVSEWMPHLREDTRAVTLWAGGGVADRLGQPDLPLERI